ncbi:hypothetical protein FA15DRAFT_690571 [Coprinopsis marcescibilis]|uniref:PAN2-PAN3 deadenylation complex catalytic subunit PAN2 n=1 Tax=Coprinopsis marcescibilis TaxID=230819 RepID=A0A5C3L9W6_COPMA|nr:hypothetical protein FA15DRAFT_690571 [Coprinopsis marcescibilis]
MTSRLDRLLLLLDTGSSTSVRNTAAKQLAQLAVKSVTSDVAFIDDDAKDTKLNRQQVTLRDRTSWAELMAVVARIIPYLHSKSYESRTAASVALSQIFSLSPVWQPLEGSLTKAAADVPCDLPPDYPKFALSELLEHGKLLLASSGKEFIKPTGILSSAAEVKKARKEAMSRLGLDFLDVVADDMDLDKELVEEMNIDEEIPPPQSAETAETLSDVDMASEAGFGSMEPTKERQMSCDTPNAPSPTSSVTPSAPEPDPSTLSAREKNRLKRKRKPGNTAFVSAPPTQPSGSKYAPAVVGSSNKARLVAAEDTNATKSRISSPAPKENGSSSDRVVIDPSKGGAVSPKSAKQSKALEVQDGSWIWDGVVKLLEVDLFSAAWEVRHGAALALRELLKVQGRFGGMKDSLSIEDNELAHEKWCNDLSAQFLCVLVLDRFGDFVSDQVIAPVRETVSQTLASLLIHMPRRSLLHVHSILLQMIRQNSLASPLKGVPNDPERSHVWEARHAGLLGIKYEVAVRNDIFDVVPKREDGDTDTGHAILKDVVDAAILGLGDKDDDVRAVAASCLLPIAQHLVEQLPESLEHVLVVLWHCLSDMKDDLSSSVGAVMDLLGTLVTYEKVINILATDNVLLPLSTLAVTLFPFFRHTISNVRLAVVKTLDSFMAVPTLPREWISAPFLRLLLQNLICEEKEDIRDATTAAWNRALLILAGTPGGLEKVIDQQLILDWFAIMMTPIGLPIDTSKFYRPTINTNGETLPERHNVDKNMLAQDLSLVSVETIMKARVAAASAMAEFILRWPRETVGSVFRVIIIHYVDSISMLQKLLSGIVAEEWAEKYSLENPSGPLLIESNDLAKELSDKTLAWLQATSPLGYHEMTPVLTRIHMDSIALLHSFHTDCKLPMSSIPNLGQDVDIAGTVQGAFTIDTARSAIGPHFNRLRDSLGRTKKKEVAILTERRDKIELSINRYSELKAQNDNRVSASFAAAFVALKSAPEKVSPVVKGVMNGVKNEENEDLQTRSAVAVARFIEFCSIRNFVQPPDKIVKNLCTFLCQDSEQTPMFSYTKKHLDGILSFKTTNQTGGKEVDLGPQTKTEDISKTRLSRRGAKLAFAEFSRKFGPKLLEVLPNIWPCMVGGLLSAFQSDEPAKSDQLIEKQFGQDVIDSLSVLEAVVPTFHPDLLHKFTQTFAMLHLGMRSRFAIVRQCSAKCFATVCDVMTNEAMRYVVEEIVPHLADPLSLSNRQGAVELVYQIVQKLDIKVLPYVIFLVVPVLGRMSDPNDDIRSTATNTFASLVKMVPLEAGLPDPPGFSEELLKRREDERQFLAQLLDGSKVEQYQIPVKINAELRKYQQEGVNWLAFLAKYQLHGILCDDMGLGKTLQSICILASKHQERADRHLTTGTPDAVHLPSLIICPPTLTGHWYYEILKYAENLKPIMYTGSSKERARLLPKLQKHDVVITSYEVVRNDIANLEGIRWLYCILDEGHVIKNAKTKLTKAVKGIQSQHRLILSGTPIQNNVLELWSLFDFLMPGFLGTEQSFNERFGKPILSNRDGKSKNGEAAALALEALHKQVLPFLLRRLKEDVLHDLPPKIIQDYYCELSDLQKSLYDDFSRSKASAAKATIQSDKVDKGDPASQHVFQSLQYLRKLCNHPALVLKDEESAKSALEKARINKDGLRDIHNAPKLLALKQVQLLLDCGIGGGPSITAESHKSELIDSTPDTSGAFSQHRVLIFCQMKQMLDIIETDLFKSHMPSVTYMRLDGSTEANKRHAIVQTFNADPSIDCLLLTTHVGGLGLTLTGADTVIFVEHDWNPMKDLQAMDRAHRIGQKRVVNVYRLITKGTLEEKIMGLQRFKLNIANSIVTQQNSGLASMDTDQVLDLFRLTTQEEDAAAATRKAKEATKPLTQKNILAALDDMPQEEYEGLDLSSFMKFLENSGDLELTHAGSMAYHPLPPITHSEIPDFSRAVTALAFDPVSDILWTGSDEGIVTAYYSSRGLRGVSFPVGGAAPVTKIVVGDSQVNTFGAGGNGIGSWAKGGYNKWSFKAPSNIATFANTSQASHGVAVSLTNLELMFLNSMTGKTVRQIPTSSLLTHLLFSHSSLISGSADGYLRLHDPRSGVTRNDAAESLVKAHLGAIAGLQTTSNLIFTIGMGERHSRPFPDPLVKIYDMRTMRPLPPLPFSSGPAFIHPLPKRSSSIAIASSQGLVNIVDTSDPSAAGEFYQLDLASYLTSFAVSPTGTYIACGDAEGTIHLLSQAADDSSLPFNGFDGQPVPWMDTHTSVPENEWNESTPLNTIGLPFYEAPLLSAWSPVVSATPYYPPAQRIPPQVLQSIKTNDNIAYAPLPKELRGRRNVVSVGPKKDSARFRSGKGRKESGSEHIALDDMEIPEFYRRVEILYSRFGVEDFDFGFYNQTHHSGLETHILNSYTNSLVQVLHYVLPIRELGKSHITTNCSREHCLLCELGFVSRMLEDAKGTNCQSSNFCRTVGVLAHDVNAIELVDYGIEHSEVDYAHKIQVFHRFLIDHLVSEGNSFPRNPSLLTGKTTTNNHLAPAPITQLIGLDAKNIIVCSNCKAVREKENMNHVVDMYYPRKDPLTLPDFGTVLQSSILRSMTHKATCQTCKQFATFTSQRSIPSEELPPILALNTAIYNEENMDFWLDSKNQTFLKPRVQVFGRQGATDDPIGIWYEIRALVVKITAKTHRSHLVALVKDPEHEDEDSEDSWLIFNDFLVRNISEKEALSFQGAWKVPAIVYLERMDIRAQVDLSGLEATKDLDILTHDTSISQNRDPTAIQHQLLSQDELPKPGTLVAIDAEFVSMQQEETEIRSDGAKKVLRPARLSLARVSVLRGDGPQRGVPFIDDHIHTSEVIVDYLTEFSGIRFGDLDPVMSRYTLTPLKVVYKKLRALVDCGCIFVGHGLSKDFRIINIFVPPEQVIDTVDLYFIRSRQRRLSLRFLSWFILGKHIQTDTHDSIEDARSALDLYHTYQELEEQGLFDQKLDELYKEGRQYNFKPPALDAVLEVSTANSIHQYPGFTEGSPAITAAFNQALGTFSPSKGNTWRG